MSVEQKIPTWALKNFKYEIGLTRRQSDFIRDKLLSKEIFFAESIFLICVPLQASLGYLTSL